MATLKIANRNGGTKEKFGTANTVDTPAILIANQFLAKGCADTVDALELAASPSAHLMPSASSVVSAPRRKVVRQGPCVMGCTVSAHHVNGVMTWRSTPSGCLIFPLGASLCETHYKQSLTASRKRKRETRIASDVSRTAAVQGHSIGDSGMQGSHCTAVQTVTNSASPVCYCWHSHQFSQSGW